MWRNSAAAAARATAARATSATGSAAHKQRKNKKIILKRETHTMFVTTNPRVYWGNDVGVSTKLPESHMCAKRTKNIKKFAIFESWNAFQAFSCYCVNVFKKGMKRVLGMVARFFFMLVTKSPPQETTDTGSPIPKPCH